jgi:lysophospholipase L1-like esterase
MYSFLALGDSYTIGEAVDPAEGWPAQLVQLLSKHNIDIADPEIIATTGWTTDELQKAIDREKPGADYDLVSLLIGVNNQYRGYPVGQYRKEFEELLQQAITFAKGAPERVVVISIPDYGVSPFAADKDPDKIALQLDEYNQISRSLAEQYGVIWVDITPGSRLAKNDAELIASDGLHPSGKMYSNWAAAVKPYAEKILHDL